MKHDLCIYIYLENLYICLIVYDSFSFISEISFKIFEFFLNVCFALLVACWMNLWFTNSAPPGGGAKDCILFLCTCFLFMCVLYDWWRSLVCHVIRSQATYLWASHLSPRRRVSPWCLMSLQDIMSSLMMCTLNVVGLWKCVSWKDKQKSMTTGAAGTTYTRATELMLRLTHNLKQMYSFTFRNINQVPRSRKKLASWQKRWAKV